jgi:hypothetical protein
MINQAFFSGYYVFIYIWFVLGAFLIGVPAVKELFRVLTRGEKGRKTVVKAEK